MRITVSLGTSLKPSEPIAEPLLFSIENLLFRGKQELWREVANVENLNLEVNEFISPWDVVRIDDKHGQSFRALVTGINISLGESVDYAITAERALL